jgi:patatin-like phospholipase/acyl hydrolase
MMDKAMKPIRILSFDGGGIRGVLTCAMLRKLDRLVPGFLENVDLFAGTSTGGIVALALATGNHTPDNLVDLYRDNAKTIFDDALRPDPLPLTRAKFGNGNLLRVLEREFGGSKLRELKHRVLIASFDLDNGQRGAERRWKAKFFHNYPGADSDGDRLVRDVAMATSMVPVYFPSYQGYVDGAVVANNPSVAALAQALASEGDHDDPCNDLGRIRLLSLGTGDNLEYISGARKDWGILDWGQRIIPAMVGGVAGVADYQCRQLLGERRYRRFNVTLGQNIPMDDTSQVPRLIRYGDNVEVSQVDLEWIKDNFV